MRVVVAMSGGVDSSVCAALLVEQGHEAIGVTMRLGHHDSAEPIAPARIGRPNCCSLEGAEDARRVAARLGIPFYALNYERAFGHAVVDYFTDEYLSGRTPNPCVLCNKELKFGRLLELADDLDAEFIATGHYARTQRRNGRYTISRGADGAKDQSYVLFPLAQKQLARTLLPLGSLAKGEVRKIARRLGLATADKPESQEVCFIADDDYKRFLRERVGENIRPGDILDAHGNVLGKHEGTAFYTVGQRRGLGVAVGHPLYVTEIRAADRAVVVGTADDLLARECTVRDVNWVSIARPTEPVRATVQIRYRDAGAIASVSPLGEGRARVEFDVPRRAITPGQAAVFYDGDVLLGGGWIE
jgi:tRNA-specific 2-thiouridylase